SRGPAQASPVRRDAADGACPLFGSPTDPRRSYAPPAESVNRLVGESTTESLAGYRIEQTQPLSEDLGPVRRRPGHQPQRPGLGAAVASPTPISLAASGTYAYRKGAPVHGS